ncbi:MAG: adenylate kinase [bacterium]|nr:adenylate kinase [bacterium]MDA1024628.1 adenylate kinase [bacterium]
MKQIVILGPQGSGKGTQANMIAEKLGIPALSMGQLLRDEGATGSDIGKEILAIQDAGNLVSDEITSNILKQRLAKDDAKHGFIIDGYPRFIEQYEASRTFLSPSHVLVITAAKEESVKRIMLRAEKEGRSDDTPEMLEKRLQWSEEKTAPVIEAYKHLGIVHEIDGLGTVEEVQARIAAALDL